jgi:nickel superoxide dismutase
MLTFAKQLTTGRSVMTRNTVLAATAALTILGLGRAASAHCEIPCGIYGDQMRIHMLREHISTIEKSMRSIETLAGESKPNWNQLNRWIANKEKHADEVQEIVTQYFMTQRVKVPSTTDKASAGKYTKQLTLLHQLLVTAMKMKQTTDSNHITRAHTLVNDFSGAYFSAADLKHLRVHK